jgi:hypothetical protein
VEELDAQISELAKLGEEIEELKQALSVCKQQARGLRANIGLLRRTRLGQSKFGKRWTKDAQREATERFYHTFKRAPQRNDFDDIEWLPASSTVCRHWGSLANLREAAGLERGLEGRGGAGRGGGWTVEKQRKPFGGRGSV